MNESMNALALVGKAPELVEMVLGTENREALDPYKEAVREAEGMKLVI